MVEQNIVINFISQKAKDNKISSYFGDMVRRLSEKGYREGLISVN